MIYDAVSNISSYSMLFDVGSIMTPEMDEVQGQHQKWRMFLYM